MLEWPSAATRPRPGLLHLLPAIGGLFLALAILATWVWVGIVESEIELIRGRQGQVIAMVSAMSKDHARRLAELEAADGRTSDPEHPGARAGNPLSFYVAPGNMELLGATTARIVVLEDRMDAAAIDRAQLATQVRNLSVAVQALERDHRGSTGDAPKFDITPGETFDGGPGNPGTKRLEPLP